MSSFTVLPTPIDAIRRERSRGRGIDLPSTPRITSPRCRPALSAGLPGVTCATSAPSFTSSLNAFASSGVISWIDTPSQPRVTLPFSLSCGQDLLGQVDRDREADRVRLRVDRGVDPDHGARQIEQRPARVARVDRGVDLQVVVVRSLAELAALRRDDPERDGVVEAERVPDRDHEVARQDPVGVAERQRGQVGHARRRGSARCPSSDRCRRSSRRGSSPSEKRTLISSTPSTTWLLVTM